MSCRLFELFESDVCALHRIRFHLSNVYAILMIWMQSDSYNPCIIQPSLSQQTVTYLPYGAASFRDSQHLYSYAPYLFQVPFVSPSTSSPFSLAGGERWVQSGCL